MGITGCLQKRICWCWCRAIFSSGHKMIPFICRIFCSYILYICFTLQCSCLKGIAITFSSKDSYTTDKMLR